MRAISRGRPAVGDLRDATVIVHHQAHRIGVWIAVIEASGLLLNLQEFAIADFGRPEVLIPLQQVSNGGQQTTVAMDVLEGHFDTVAASGCGVGDGTPLYDPRVIVAPGRLRHPHWREDPLPREVGERLPTHARDDDGGEIVTTVAV